MGHQTNLNQWNPSTSIQTNQATKHLSAIFTIIPKAELRDPQVKDLYHGELVIPPGKLTVEYGRPMVPMVIPGSAR